MQITVREFEIKIGNSSLQRRKVVMSGSPDEVSDLLTMHPQLLSGRESAPRISRRSGIKILEIEEKNNK